MGFLTGREVMAIVRHFSPFAESGELRPEDERATILAANLVQPLDVLSRGFAMAAAEGDQSPLLVQFSHSALNMAGGDPGLVPLRPGAAVVVRDHLVAGARMARAVLKMMVEQYGAGFLGITLDHFRVPKFNEVLRTGAREDVESLAAAVAGARVEDAARAASGVRGGAFGAASERECVLYMTSQQYADFKKGFLAVVREARPAWGMIDTETLPPALVFAVTRDIKDELRHVAGNTDMILEAEFGATGQSGDDQEYERLSGPELMRLAVDIAKFVEYSGAEAIAYPAGMVHASRLEEKHEPDVERILAVHREIMQRTGRYVPYAQHGGTGASFLPRGLVGKNNIATRFLVVGMNHLLAHCEADAAAIREGSKSACSPAVFARMSLAIAGAAVEKLKECGSYGKGPEVARVLEAAGFQPRPVRAADAAYSGSSGGPVAAADGVE